MRRAFIFSGNGPPSSPRRLRFAHKDADRMQATLEGPRCRYIVKRPPADANRFEIQQALYQEAAKCQPEDTFLVYFAGHGLIEGGLTLLLDTTDPNELLSTALPAQDVMQALRRNPAKTRILILDCCNAGTLAREMGLRSERVSMDVLGVTSENFDILLASDHLEFARELDMFGGGFFTTSICSAITTEFAQADLDDDGALSVAEVSYWLELRANDHNATYPEFKVFMPRRVGFGHGDAFITLPPDVWPVHEIQLIDGLTAVVLPVAPIANNFALALGRYPVTNRVYHDFVEKFGNIGYTPPVGERYVEDKGWVRPFKPWDDPAFSDPDQPVVCVKAWDARNFCDWLQRYAEGRVAYAAPPTSAMWDLAAFGTPDPVRRNSRMWLSTSAEIHHKDISPRACVNASARTNIRGFVDMIGNVWEWCGRPRSWPVLFPNHAMFDEELEMVTGGPYRRPDLLDMTELRGGSFLDDLERVSPFFNVSELKDGEDTSHSDLGFRVAVMIEFRWLPQEIRERVMNCKPLYPEYQLSHSKPIA
jgi:formylglycine-generating enzyme required for sulfatase activity